MSEQPLGRISVVQGNNPGTPSGSVGGISAYIDDDGRAVVILGIAERDDSKGRRVHLHEGETFELGPELWEVTEIVDASSRQWGAGLTRLR